MHSMEQLHAGRSTFHASHQLALQLFSCASGVYLLGTERHFSPDNNLVISKMLDEEGEGASHLRPAALAVPVLPIHA